MFASSEPEKRLVEALRKAFPDASSQYKLASYYIDCAIPSLRIAVEYQGAYWHQDMAKEERRAKTIRDLGWKLVLVDKSNLDVICANPEAIRWL